MYERALTARDVAHRYGVELKTVHNWVERGLLRYFRTPGRHLRFKATDVDEFLSRHAGAPRATASVLVIGPRLKLPAPSTWFSVRDAYEGLCRAGTERPSVVVMDASSLASIDEKRYVRALRRALPRARLFWFGSAAPRGLRKALEVVSNVADLRRRITPA